MELGFGRKGPDGRPAANDSPASRIPDKLWMQILVLAYAHRFPYCHSDGYAMPDMPIPFSHVSHRFRELVQNEPAFWTCIHITPRRDPGRDQLGLLREQIRRSQSQPLTILFSCQTMSDDAQSLVWRDSKLQSFRNTAEFAYFTECWRLLLPLTVKWRRLSFYARHSSLANHFLVDTLEWSRSFSLLEHLDVWVFQNPADAGIPPLDLAQLRAPILSCLRWYRFGCVLPQPPHRLHLTELVLYELPQPIQFRNFAKVLESTGGTLRTLIVRDVTLTGEPVVMRLPQLRYFALEFFLAIGVMPDLSCAVLRGAPQLKRVDLADSAKIGGSFHQPFVSHVYPSVETLLLSGHARSHPDHLETLSSFPGLRHLAVTDDVHAIINTMLELSKAVGEEAPLWPNLQKLTLAEDKKPVALCNCLQDFVRHRADIRKPIRVLSLQPALAASLGPAALRWFRAQAGLSTIAPREDILTTNMGRWNGAKNTPKVPFWINSDPLQTYGIL